MSDLLGSFASGAINLMGGMAANQQNMQLARDQMQWNQEQATTAYRRQREMWRLNNRYNSPMAQRKRMEEAGFNPALFYGQGTPGNATQPSVSQASPYQQPSIQNPTPSLNFGSEVRESKKTKQLIRQIQQEIVKSVNQTNLFRSQNEAQEFLNGSRGSKININLKQWREWFPEIAPSGYTLEQVQNAQGPAYPQISLTVQQIEDLQRVIGTQFNNLSQKFKNAVEELRHDWANQGLIYEGTQQKEMWELLGASPVLFRMAITAIMASKAF